MGKENKLKKRKKNELKGRENRSNECQRKLKLEKEGKMNEEKWE